ncbi:MAG: beta-glucuronidase [Actinomycetaceae bacterium]|nr:beta-glucuronidase [Actinomycetaceae bacterium]
MLTVRQTASRNVFNLDGVWDFKVDKEDSGTQERWFAAPLKSAGTMAVPASYNDVVTDTEVRDHVGVVWYQRQAHVPRNLGQDRLVLRFGSATHAATVWVDENEVMTHEGGYLPFEADITDYVTPGQSFRITVAVDNRLNWQTIPPGYIFKDTKGRDVQRYMHDFYNYAGIHRSVLLYTRPAGYVEDVTVVTDIDGSDGVVSYRVEAPGTERVHVRLLDAEGAQVGTAEGTEGKITVANAHLWAPGDGYLYTLQIHADEDIYPQTVGIRTVEVKDSQFLINGKPFYFRGYGRHEDNIVRGKSHDNVMMVHDFELMKWQGANSFRTSHYPYAEEVMDYADREGFVVIDETAAVGLNIGLSGGIFGTPDGMPTKTFSPESLDARTQQVHEKHIRDLIARDKNHPCVVLWSIANEPESNTEESYEYFKPLAQAAREADPTRPVGYVNVMLAPPQVEKCVGLFDVVMLNRYYGWYVDTGLLEDAQAHLQAEIEGWIKLAPGKPIIFTEYGPDTLSGLRDLHRQPWSEEFQEDMFEMFHRVFDSFDEVVGEQMWNFADFQTVSGILRVGGNKKGMFTRDRKPKSAAYQVRKRWQAKRDETGC